MKTTMYIRYLLIGLMSIFCLFACNDDNESYDFVGNEGCVYIREVRGSREFPVHEEIFTVPTMVFGNVELKFPVHSTMPVKEKIEVDLLIDNSLIESYNEANNTSYVAIDSKYLQVKNLKLTIEEGEKVSSDSLTIAIPEEYYRDIENGDYMIPVRMEKVSGYLKATSLEENTEMYLIISVFHSDSNVRPGNSSEGESVIAAERTGWTAFYSGQYVINNYTSKEVDINIALFDQTSETSCKSTDFKKGDYLLVDLGKKYSNISSIYIQYGKSSWRHSEFELYISNDQENWIKQGTVIPNSVQTYTSFYAPLEARYIKIVGLGLPYTTLSIADFDIYLKR